MTRRLDLCGEVFGKGVFILTLLAVSLDDGGQADEHQQQRTENGKSNEDSKDGG
jgi:hypothetical protein